MNPVAGAIFSGIILIVLVYSTLDLTGAADRLGKWGTVLPLPVIASLMLGIYLGLKRLDRYRTRIRSKGPLYLRSLMNSCLRRDCGDLETMLNKPEISSAAMLDAILLDKMLWIGTRECRYSADIRRQIEDSGLKGTADLALSRLFQTVEEYREQAPPVEIRQVDDLVTRSRADLQGPLERLKRAHQTLCSGNGDILALLPPNPQKAEKIRAGYRLNPPSTEGALRMAFALETLAYLRAVRYKNLDPRDRRRYDAAAEKGIPALGAAFKNYKQAWQDLVDAYEQPDRD